MTDKVQKIREEVERLKSQLLRGACSSQIAMETRCKEEAYNEVLALLDIIQKEPVSEDKDLEETINTIKLLTSNTALLTFEYGFRKGAKWQKQKDNNNANHALVEQIKTQQMCYEKGMSDMKQQMLAKAINIEVKVDSGGYPYIPQMELYDYDKDIPLAKKGDKYNVVLIKED